MTELSERPSIFAYNAISSFVGDMIYWRRRAEPDFSVRQELSALPGCSPALVTQISQGKRRLTRDQVTAFGKLLRLSGQETRFLDHWVATTKITKIRQAALNDSVGDKKGEQAGEKSAEKNDSDDLYSSEHVEFSRPQNHLVSDWLHAYVKETCRLKGFRLSPKTVHRLLGGMAPIEQITKSFDFLIREGFWRRTLGGSVVLNEPTTETSDGIPVAKIKQFHKKALEIAKRGLDLYRPGDRQAGTYILTVNDRNRDKIKAILNECMDRLQQFEQDYPNEDERLYQVTVHLTPIAEGERDLQ